MKLEDQVCNLKLSLKIDTLGFFENSQFWWVQWSGGDWTVCSREMLSLSEKKEVLKRVPAFNASELGNILPANTNSWKGDESDLWYSMREENEDSLFRARTQADALAKMLIHLIEKGIVKP